MADYLLTGINPDLRRRVKSVLAAEGRTIKGFLLECLERKAKGGVMILINSFHNSEITLDPSDTYETKSGEMVAVFSERQIKTAAMALCGIKDCTCHKFETYCVGDDGRKYTIAQKS